MPASHILLPGQSIQLANISTKGKSYHSNRAEAEIQFRQLRQRLIELQTTLYAESQQSLLVVLQAMDAGGKDGTIRHVFKGVNPQGVQVSSFKKPSSKERSHDFLWRIHKAVPSRGMIGVFNRSHYEDVLVVRVDQIVPESVWSQRYAVINEFEKHLTQCGTRILKLFLHISRKEQKERFEDRLNQPHKRWKFDKGDLKKRDQWDQYQTAFEDMLNKCTTTYAPWHVIPADQKWYRNLAVTQILVDTLENMNPQYPTPADLTDVTVPT